MMVVGMAQRRLLSASSVLLCEPMGVKPPQWQMPAPPGYVLKQHPWSIDDSSRDCSKKYSKEEMKARYSTVPDPRRYEYHPDRCEYIPVEKVPADLYAYGQEGQELKEVAIFKDQKAPKIAPMEEYPFIFHILADQLGRVRLRQDWRKMDEEGLMTPELRVAQMHLLNRSALHFHSNLAATGPRPPRKARGRAAKK